jgi:hypothetical protein
MKIPVQHLVIPGLAVLCGVAAIALIPAVHLPRQAAGSRESGVRAIPSPGLDLLNADSPSMQEVVAKHLFIPQRKATGQNSFPDLLVKGVFIGSERSAVLSLKSKPQANLRVWSGGTAAALSQITDPRDPRRPIADFLREWNIKEIGFNGVTVSHFITGETETYAVDYDPLKKVKDDASRGYGQGIMPQAESAQASAARTANGNAPRTGTQQSGGNQPVNLIADRISEMMQRMSPDQKKQLLQQIGKNAGGGNQAGGNNANSKSSSQTGSKNTSSGSKNTQTGNKTQQSTTKKTK